MKNINIVSMIKVNGEWVEQGTLPQSMVLEIVANTITRAAKQIGFERITTKDKKTA